MNRAVLTGILLFVVSTFVVNGCGADPSPSDEGSYSSDEQRASSSGSVPGVPFAWPFRDLRNFKPRGGTTRGTSVQTAQSPSEEWTALQERDLNKKERDRRAILAMTGSYRVSFQFTETMGFTEGYEPAKPYFSWATEHVRAIESTEDLIRLQHIIVMYYEEDDGNVRGPKVMKHWRQDWRYEDRGRFVYEGEKTWHHEKRDAHEVEGTWTQSVYQVDDGLRYEAIGRWTHGNGYSTWESRSFRRPLPRREYTVRDDYDLLQGSNTITVTRSGWVHRQDNAKVKILTSGERQIAREIGVNRYERISEPDLQGPASEYWDATGTFWRIVREEWDATLNATDRFQLNEKVDGQKLYHHLFGRSRKLQESKDLEPDEARAYVRQLLEKYVVTDGDE